MPQVFHPSMNTISRVSIFGAIFIIGGIVWLMGAVVRSDYMTEVGVVKTQPVPFSHRHHVGDIGIDCRYCHQNVEESSSAGMPSTALCMNCHSQLYTESDMLAPIRESYSSGEPMEWTRVHDVPDFVHFNHSIHVKKGVGCYSCHGEVDEMPLMWRESSLHMEWCLDCHRNPEEHVRPKEFIYTMDSLDELLEQESFVDEIHAQFPSDAEQVLDNPDMLGEMLVKEYDIKNYTNCSACHY